jgi:hypothetical protein
MKAKYVLLLAVTALAAGCGGSEYGEFQQALRHQWRMMEEFTVAVEQATGPEAAAAALKKFRKEVVAGREWMVKLTTERPGLADLEKADLPEDVRADLVRIEEVTPRFVAALQRVEEEYGRDPEVRKALDGMGSVFSPPSR